MSIYRRSLNLFALLILVLIISSCAFSSTRKPVIETKDLSKSKIYQINADDLYKIVDNTIITLGYTIKEKNDDLRSIKTHVKQVEIAANCNCGTWNGMVITGYAGSELLAYIVIVDENSSQLYLTSTLTTRFQGKNLYGVVTRDETYSCKSYGIIEDNFFQTVNLILANGSDKKLGQPNNNISKEINISSKNNISKVENKITSPTGYRSSEGFRDLKWGDSLSDIQEMEHIATDSSYGGVEKYVRLSDKLKIGGAELESIVYGFWRGKLMTVNIGVQGLVNFSSLRDAAFKRFGKGYQDNQFIECYSWSNGETYKLIEFSEITDKGTLWMQSKHIVEQAKFFDNLQAEEGAKTGF